MPPHVHTRVIAHDLPAREEDLALVDVDDGVLHPSHSLQGRLEDGNGLPGPLLQPGGLQLPRLQARLRRQHPHGERLARAWGAVQQHDRNLRRRGHFFAEKFDPGMMMDATVCENPTM